MTNERAQRIVDLPADLTVDESIAPPPIDRDDDESQLEDQLAEDATTAELAADAEDETAEIEVAASLDDEIDEDDRTDLEAEAADLVGDLDASANGDDETDDDDLDTAAEASVEAADAAAEAETSEDEDTDDTAESDEALAQQLEALLFVADEPIAPAALGRALELTPRQVRRGLDDLADALREDNRGVRLQQGPDGAQLVTAPEAAGVVELFLGLEANRRLSNAALETLAIIAYRQPVTRHVIDQIRGVNSDGAIATLRARGLIEGIGRAPGPGRPLLFSTTQRFLEHFGLERPDQLPPLPDDVELPPEAHGAQLALGSVAQDDDAPDNDVAEAPVEELDESEAPELRLDLGDEDDEDDDLEEFDAPEDDPELEISGDLDDLSRAAGAALAGPPDDADGTASDI